MLPLISCVIPTADRRSFLPDAIRCYEAQKYPNKELIVVDNGADSIRDLVPVHAKYLYIDGTQKLTTGAMRNRANALAKGAYIAHFDDDDFSHPFRLQEQYRAIVGMGCTLTGYNEMYFIDEVERKAWSYRNPELYALGTSLFYSVNYWRGNKFPDKPVAEDTEFIGAAAWRRSMVTGSAGDRMVARIHARNTSPKQSFMLQPPMWTAQPYERIKEMTQACIR